MRRISLVTLAALISWAAAAPCAAALAGRPALLSFTDLLIRPRPLADKRVPYGSEPEQFGELWLPKSAGPHPVVVLIHGGCWLASLPGVDLMSYVADDLRTRGYAVWNIEYRRVGDTGGGYPGTFEDVGRAVDDLRALAGHNGFDLRHVVLVGHSAGGQLALWAAGRRRIDKASPLHAPDPLPVSGVVSLAGIDDLETYRRLGPDACGGPPTIDALVGADHRPPAKIYADTSPAALLPIGVPQAVFSGALDPIVPAVFGADYAAKAVKTGDAAQAVILPDAGHFELIDPRSPAWKAIVSIIARMER